MSLRPYLLGGVAVVLAALVGQQYWPQSPQTRPVAVAARSGGAVPTLNPQAARGAADFAALFDHPLFDPTRNKPADAAPVEAAPAQPVEAAPVEVPTGPAQPVLMGTVTSPWPGGAYLGDDQGGPVVFLRPGQAALGLHLEAVQNDRATFMFAAGEVTLTLPKTDAPAGVGAVAPDGTAPPTVAPTVPPVMPSP